MSASVLQQAQLLDTDPLVELWELDTSPCSNIFGEVGEGAVYHWTPGVLNYRDEGTVLLVGNSATFTLDRAIGVENSALTYMVRFQSASDPNEFTPPVKITGWGSTTVSGVLRTIVGLDSAPSEIPAIGAGWVMETTGSVFFGGVEYKPAPIELNNMEWSGQGSLPRPTLRINNIGGLAGALVARFGDILGAKVTRLQTFKSFLDGEATPDSSAIYEPDIFTVDRKSAHNRTFIEFELAADFDQQGVKLPKRLVLRDACDHSYRQWSLVGGGHFVYGTCPYTDFFYFRSDGSAGLTPQEDICGKRLHDCILRFGDNARLPFRGFPGAAEVHV